MIKKPTGRRWGDKYPPKEYKQKIEGIPVIIKTADFWEGPVEVGEEGQYIRGVWLSE